MTLTIDLVEGSMNQRTYNIVSGIFILAVCLMHVYRASTGASLNVAGFDVPIAASWVAAVFTGFLGFSAVKLLKG